MLVPVNNKTRAYDGDHAWADYDAGGNVLARYLFGDRMDENLARWRPSEGTAWYLTAGFESVCHLLEAWAQDELNVPDQILVAFVAK